jgi:DNA-binding response OmpR family regulator
MSPPTDEDHPLTVLVVEDDEGTRDAMLRILAAQGYQVLTAATAHDALGVLDQPLAPIDVVVLDVHLPDASGIDVCRQMRSSRPHLPVVVCSGEASPDEVADLLRLGAFRYFTKPISVDELLATVEAALDRQDAGTG